MTSEFGDELDRLSLDLLDLSQQLIEAKLRMEQRMKTGFLWLSKSRVERSKRYHVPVQHQDDEKLALEFKSKVSLRSTECVRGQVRFNYTTYDQEIEKKGSKTAEINPAEVNPLTFFGGLLPDQSLRKSAGSFAEVIDKELLEVVNITNEINGIVARIKYINRKSGKKSNDDDEEES